MVDFSDMVDAATRPVRVPVASMSQVGDYFDVPDSALKRSSVKVMCTNLWQGTHNRRFATFAIDGGTRVILVDTAWNGRKQWLSGLASSAA